MSGYVTGLVLRNSSMKGAARMVMVVIAEACDDDGTHAWPSMNTIAERAGIGRRTAQIAVQDCQKAGELAVKEHEGGPRDRPERYRTHSYSIPINGWIVAEGDRVRGVERTPLVDPGVQFATDQGCSLQQIRGVERTPDSSLDSSLDPNALFDRFYAIYPRKKEPINARKAFIKALKLASAEEIIAGAERYRDDPTRKKEFTAFPATWLNKGRWGDEADAPDDEPDDGSWIDAHGNRRVV